MGWIKGLVPLMAAALVSGCVVVPARSISVPPVARGDVSRVQIGPARADAAETRALSYINSQRKAAGLRPVRSNPRLQAAAESHSRWMARNATMSHRGAGGTDMLGRMRAAGYRACGANENVAYGQRTAERVVRGWISSPGHRRNILARGMQHGAVAAVRDGRGTIWWTMVMGDRC